jgi:ATP-dependent DNA helicase RecG
VSGAGELRAGADAGPVRRTGRSLRALRDIPVSRVSQIGDKRAKALGALGIESVLDLLTHYPRRYVDRTRQAALAELQVGEEAVVLAEVRAVASRRTRQGRSLVEIDLDDGTGRLRVGFFNQPWRVRQLPVGTEAMFFGRLERYRGRRVMVNPVVDLLGDRTGRIVPVYPTSERSGIGGWEFGAWIAEALRRAGPLEDPLPARLRGRLGLMERGEAMRAIHAPSSFAERDAARRRLAFDELLRLQLQVVMRRQALERQSRGIRHVVDPPPGQALVEPFLRSLPFALTGAQRRAIDAIAADLAGPLPMHRLLQGDVGSGKTVVAVAALLIAVQGGHQGALMAPTEVLAEQHYLALRRMLRTSSIPDAGRLDGQRPVTLGLLTNRTTAAERARLLAALERGELDLVVGTHALIGGEVRFASLGMVVVDEQHRFGVEQRAALRAKGGRRGDADPDLLVMTATPIPRTAAMAVFGDLDVTELDELPPGRSPVHTRWVRDATEEAEAWERVRAEAGAGRRAYVVCPLVEGSGRVQAASATAEAERLAGAELVGLRLGLLHGQMKPADKELTMDRFRAGELDVLVATTVIEVGVDVPEATVMVVEDAQHFGIAQLHQLRGRVGRSGLASWCYLLSAADGPEAVRRLEALEASTDGFDLAEVDLELRGEGTILGTRQKGRSDLKLASLRRGDRELVELARAAAEELLGADPDLARAPGLADELALLLDEEEADFLAKS